MKAIKLILMLGFSLFIVSCGGDSDKSSSDNGWSDSTKSEMLKECMEAPDTNEELCQCMLDATSSEFTYQEYEMLQNASPDASDISEEMQERTLKLMMTMMECAL